MMAATFNLFKWFSVGMLVVLLQACPSTGSTPQANADASVNPNANVDANATVTDPVTGLIWMRCAMGMTWTGSTCTGEARTYTFDQANALTGTVTFAGQSDWRLPNIRELQTIVDRSVYGPAIDFAAFPNTPNVSFWSSTPYAANPDYALLVGFSGGSVSYVPYGYFFDRSVSFYPYGCRSCERIGLAVRLVRGGESSGSLLSITRPTSDYVDHGDGTVTHTPTNLTWKRCVEGQTWTGSTCGGAASTSTDASTGATASAGQNDWRLPTADELVSLVDYSAVGPMINTRIFPATPASAQDRFSSSSRALMSPHNWFVRFDNGQVDYGYSSKYERPFNWVRLVRGGRFSPVPVCTLSANPASITPGASAILTARCSPAAASYTWTAGTCAGGTAATCTVTPARTITYSVAGANEKGIGAVVGATVTVSAASTLQANTDGTVTDAKTGLTWMRCAMGMTWTGNTCTGEASTYAFDQANALPGTVTFSGQSDWRMPNIRELQTIVDRSVYNPAIDRAAFPNTPSVEFWSGSPDAYSPSQYAWFVHFGSGYDHNDLRGGGYAVRLVRGGQSFGSLLSIMRPTSDYLDNGDGTVTHTPTNLTWKRCVEGQVWTGSTCGGTVNTYSFNRANALTGTTTFAGSSDWRLPTVDELLSLVDYSTAAPAINANIFPDIIFATSNRFLWSSSPDAYDAGRAWSFLYGVNGFHAYVDDYRVNGSGAAWLVRSGR